MIAGSTNSGQGKVEEAARLQGTAMLAAEKDLAKLGDEMTALSALRVDAGKNDEDSSPIAEDAEQIEVDEDVTDSITTSSCLDNTGYYLNHHGRAVQCSWLIDGRDPTNESRRIHNCGYGDGGGSNSAGNENPLLPAATDLGKMCKNTCGTCMN